MRFPTVHLNGTSKAHLYEQYETQVNALRAAIKALEENGPNARDYYHQGRTAFQEAEHEHRARLAAIKDVMREIYFIWEYVTDV